MEEDRVPGTAHTKLRQRNQPWAVPARFGKQHRSQLKQLVDPDAHQSIRGGGR